MPVKWRTGYRIVIGIAFIILFSCMPALCTDQTSGMDMMNTSGGISGTDAAVSSHSGTISPGNSSPAIVSKPLAPAIERKISSNLLYILDSDLPEKGMSRVQAAGIMRATGQMKTVQPASEDSPAGAETIGSVAPVNQVYVYVDLVPSAPVSGLESYFQKVTDLNEEDHTVAGWVDIKQVDRIASLENVSDIRFGDPTITRESPVYHDTKFINKRAGMPPATVEEVKASVQKFENDPEMRLDQMRTMKTPRGDVYEMASESGRYFVNAKTGDVELVFYCGRSSTKSNRINNSSSRNSLQSQTNNQKTFDQAYSIAQKYIEINYDSFFNRTMILAESSLMDHGAAGKIYYFTWMEKINEVLVPNVVSVSIDSENGEVLSYIRQDQPVNINFIPTISKNSAISIAITAFSLGRESASDTRLFVQSVNENKQRLVWIVSVVGHSNSDVPQGGDVIIDAQTGQIVQLNPYE